MNSYKTILNKEEYVYVEKKSKFIANVNCIYDELSANEFLLSIKKKYPDARHNCFAYKILQPIQITKISDDGEPSGTAGSPILSVIEGNSLFNVIIVVTRYFGGILLGTGGLIRAYTIASKEVIQSSTIIEKKLCQKFLILLDYNFIGQIKNMCAVNDYYIETEIYKEQIELTIFVEKILAEKFINDMNNITNGKAIINIREIIYF